METDKFGRAITESSDAFTALYNGVDLDLSSLEFKNAEAVDQFNAAVDLNADHISKIKQYKIFNESMEFFDEANQCEWFMPEDYCPNLVEMLYGLCETEAQTERVSTELHLYIQHNMLDVLFYLKYLVDIMRANNIVWGVGRGSSVASYILYLLGVHKVDSIRYNLDINEFLKEETTNGQENL